MLPGVPGTSAPPTPKRSAAIQLRVPIPSVAGYVISPEQIPLNISVSSYGKRECNALLAESVYAVKTVEAIQSEIMINGPVTAALTVYDDFMYYKQGVYQVQSRHLQVSLLFSM